MKIESGQRPFEKGFESLLCMSMNPIKSMFFKSFFCWMMIFKCISLKRTEKKTRKTNFGFLSSVFSKTHICRLFYDLSRSVSPDDMKGQNQYTVFWIKKSFSTFCSLLAGRLRWRKSWGRWFFSDSNFDGQKKGGKINFHEVFDSQWKEVMGLGF